MLYLKEFTEERAVIVDLETKNEFLVEAVNDQSLDRDLLEDIIDYGNRQETMEENK